jgi:DNA-binding NarL/FixJ family response regulator
MGASEMKVTKRQAQALDALCEHGNNKLIARALNVDIRAVETMLSRIKARTGIESRIVLAVRWDRLKRPIV